MKNIFISFLLVLAASPALACEPVASTLQDKIKAADVIFAGRVAEVTPPDTITFEVLQYWKGAPAKRLTLRTVADTCGISGVTPGIEMMIFAKGTPLVTMSGDGDYVMKIPGGKPINDAADIEKALGPGKTPE